MSKSLTIICGLVPGEGVEPPSPTYAVVALALSYPGGPRFAGWACRGRELGLAVASAQLVHGVLVLWLLFPRRRGEARHRRGRSGDALLRHDSEDPL